VNPTLAGVNSAEEGLAVFAAHIDAGKTSLASPEKYSPTVSIVIPFPKPKYVRANKSHAR